MDTRHPEWAAPQRQDTAPTDLSYWTNLNPNLYGQDSDVYIVIPKLGIISPVTRPSLKSVKKQAYTKLIDGQSYEYNQYLQDGVLQYPNSADLGTMGKTVIFGHSTYLQDDP